MQTLPLLATIDQRSGVPACCCLVCVSQATFVRVRKVFDFHKATCVGYTRRWNIWLAGYSTAGSSSRAPLVLHCAVHISAAKRLPEARTFSHTYPQQIPDLKPRLVDLDHEDNNKDGHRVTMKTTGISRPSLAHDLFHFCNNLPKFPPLPLQVPHALYVAIWAFVL
ncbi:uncharacterized protein BDZ99DRAFT_196315 [Mytilinidion resinicola]|uniref:Uncharacterized protein n=1 Tax=Mytilinidion resinicola TaxID=574789 RepID=A0A6A6Z3Y8_9PEZI|nr:uncharacterized protein BDZ99DRAFT_196315 [Mytilinidion resinicola]KAF2815449.1 hypothetical protein BDZ99DRAFT_196315 [Mytilinidion resinicola]